MSVVPFQSLFTLCCRTPPTSISSHIRRAPIAPSSQSLRQFVKNHAAHNDNRIVKHDRNRKAHGDCRQHARRNPADAAKAQRRNMQFSLDDHKKRIPVYENHGVTVLCEQPHKRI